MSNIRSFLEKCAGEGDFPGAVYALGESGKKLEESCVGEKGGGFGKTNMDTVYDIASVTKPIVCLALMKLMEEGALCLDDAVGRFLPEFAGHDKAEVTVFELLTHTSVIPGQMQLYRTCRDKAAMLEAIRFYVPRDRTKERVMYSSQGMMLVGEIIERLYGEGLDKALDKLVLGPLGMGRTMYNPGEEVLHNIAPTENCPWRGRVVRGQVHDENAVVMGGVCGHAGLFSTAGDLAKLCAAMLTGVDKGGGTFLKRRTVRLMTKNHTAGENLARGLGWQKKDAAASPAGDYFTDSSFGHTGFTGTSVWIDPELDFYAVLLTNRVHPSRDSLGLMRARKIFHNLAVLRYRDSV